jgi:hypothetical protein
MTFNHFLIINCPSAKHWTLAPANFISVQNSASTIGGANA